MAELKDLLVNGQSHLIGDAIYKTHASTVSDDRIASTLYVKNAVNDLSTNISAKYKTKLTAKTDPIASADVSTTFITSITLNENGEITATKKTVPSLSLSTSGNGNAVTSVSVSGHTVTVYKSETFATVGQIPTIPSITVTVTGSGNAITTASATSHSITLTKGETFSTSGHNHDSIYAAKSHSHSLTITTSGTGNGVSGITGAFTTNGLTLTVSKTNFATTNSANLKVLNTTTKSIGNSESTGSYVKFTGGTNKFTVTDNNNATFDVAITPSIANNVTYTNSLADGKVAIFSGTSGVIQSSGYTIAKSVPSTAEFTDTKNTAGATASINTKLFLVGAPAQVTSTVTYTNESVYIASDNTLYSGGKQVLTSGDLPTNSKIQLATLSFSIPDSSKISEITLNPNGEITVTTTAAPWLLPGDVAGGVQYKGDVNANTLVISSGDASLNGKTLTAAKEESGYMFTINTAGTIAGQAMEVGDSIIFKKDVLAGTAVAATDITYIEASVSVTQYNSPSMQWGTDTSIITVDGVTAKAKTPSTMIGWRLLGSGINSLMNSTVGTGINPAVNGLGYNTKVGKTVTNKDGAQAKIFMTRDGVEFEFTNPDGYINLTILLYLFDGRNSTSIQLTVPSIFLSTAGLAEYNYSATKAYAVGDFVRYMTANIKSNGDSDYAWYRCIQATTGNAPSGVVETGNTYWEYMSGLKPSYYTGINPSKLSELRVRLYLTSSIAYENGVSVYWRTNGLHPTYMKLQKIKGDESGPNGGFMYPISDIGASTDGNISNQTVSSVYFSQGASTANDNKIIDFIFTGLSGNSTWACVPTQFAFTGNCGSLEGTLLNRGGGTGSAMYGDFLPYKTDTLNLGNNSYRWNNLYAKNILISTINGATPALTDTTYSAGTDLTLSGTTFNHKTSGVTAGGYGSSTLVPIFTVSATGHITSATVATITNTTYSAGTGLTLSGTTINHANSIGAGTASGTAATLTFGGTFTIPKVGYNATGHITSTGSVTMTMPTETKLSVTSSGSGNAIDGLTVNDHKITFTKNTTFATSGHNHDSNYAAKTHSHGNISSTGSITTSVSIANGDRLLIMDNSDSNKITTSSISFDGSTTTSYLSKKGTWESIPTIPSLTISTTGTGDFVTGVTASGHTITVSKGNVPSLTLSTHGSGNAITTVSVSGHKIDVSFGQTFITENDIPSLSLTSSITGTATTFVKAISVDGHSIAVTLSTVSTAAKDVLGLVKTSSTTTSTTGLTAVPIINGIPYYKDTNTTYTFGATSPINVTVSGTTVTYSHATSGVTAGTYGSGDAIPKIIVNNTGHITGLTTVAVNKGTYAETSLSIATHGSGNAVTSVSVSNHKIDVSLGETFSTSGHTHNYAGSPTPGGTANKTASIPYAAVDTTSTAKAFTATVDGITELRDGVCVYLKNSVVTSTAGFTLNINNLGAKRVCTNLATASYESSKFNKNYTMLFIYNSSRVSGGCWDCYNGYDTNTQNTAGATLSNAKLFLVGSTATGGSKVTYANASVWLEDGFLYSNKTKVSIEGHTHSEYSLVDHTHGNISSTGSLTDTAAAAAGNDYIVIRDADNNKIQTSTIKGTDVVDAISNKHSHSTGTVTIAGFKYDGSHTLSLPSTDPYTSARTPSAHTHGNITNDGKITTSNSIANGDAFVISRTTAGTLSKSTITFDGATTNSFLSKKGTWETPAAATDEKVKQLSSTTNQFMPILGAYATTPTSGTNGQAYYNQNIAINTSTNTIKVNACQMTYDADEDCMKFTFNN